MVTSSPNSNNPHEKSNGQPTTTKPKKGGFFKRLLSSDNAKTKYEVPKATTQHVSNPEIKPKPSVQEVKGTTVVSVTTTIISTTTTTTTTSAKIQQPKVQQQQKLRCDIFPQDVAKPIPRIELPKKQGRIERTPQLVYCASLLLKDGSPLSLEMEAQDQGETLGETQRSLLKEMEQDPIEQDHIRWLGARMVEEFIKDPCKDSVEISEIVLLSPVLQKEHYRKLLSCFIKKFDESRILDVDLLQGLVQLVQSASSGFLVSDDLIKILSILRSRLEGTHQQSSEHPYHLTLAVSRMLDVMAEYEVQDLDRVLEHEPLSGVLSGLKGTSDPYLMYQACYAFQALQYVPDDETALKAVLRHSAGVFDGLVKIAGAVKLDVGSVLEGLGDLQEALGSTIETVGSVYEGVYSLMESGCGVFDSLKEGFGSGQKRPWYAALRVACTLAQAGQLKDLNQLICEAPCRRDPLFQWGICQLLGEIVVDPVWTVATRQQAMDLLRDLYKNDLDWRRDVNVKDWMLTIIGHLARNPEQTIKEKAHSFLQDVNRNLGDMTQHPYPLRARLPKPSSSPILARVQNIPDIDYDLHKVHLQRLEEASLRVYIPPMAKANLQAKDDDLFLLMDKVQDFLSSNRQVMLILGDSGAGKSTFNKHLESELWHSYKRGDRIPLFVNLPALDRPDRNLMIEQLKMHNFSDDQIREFKMHRKFVVICDGYDESKLVVNIHTFNLFNRPGQWDVKLVISCRSQYLSQDYRGRFIPQGGVHYDRLAPDLFQEAVIAPFSREQIHNYVDQYVPLEPRTWSTGDYMDKLTTIPNLMDLVKNPFLLTLALEALPGVTEGKQDLSTMKITRVQLYDTFVRHWLNVNKRRLEAGVFSKEEHDILDQLLEADFTLLGIEYSMRLAFAIFNKQDGNPIVQYVHLKDKESWKAEFFSPDPEVRFLRDSSPLARSGRLHRFLHRSILEYFFSCTFYDSNTVDKDNTEFALQPPSSSTGLLGPISDHPLSQRSLMSEPSIIQFLAERVQSNLTFKQQLLNIIELSKTDAQASQAAANAITILVKAGIRFSEADLKGIRVPGSNLSGGEFDSTQLQGADLSNANLTKTWLRKANLSGAMMTGTNFGEWPYVKEEDHILSCAFSSDGKTFLVGLFNWQVKVYETKNWGLVHTLVGHTHNVNKVAISSNGLKIASASDDKTVRLWEARTGQAGHVLSGHEGQVSGVAFSPNNQQVASCGWDSTIRLWNVATGESGAVFQGHYTVVSSVAFSPSGLQIASTSWDETVRIWDVHSGNAVRTLTGHSDGVASVAFSPDGIHLASSGWDKTIRVWNASTGLQELVMSGHTSSIATVDYSSDGQHLVSSSEDNTVRVWGSRTGAPGPTLNGHTGGTTCAVFSPSGKYIASSSFDKTVRLWDTNPDAYTTTTSTGHTRNVNTVSYSPCGLQILSSSWDATARLWDAELGTPGTVFRGHTRGVWRAVYSPDGQFVATGSADQTARIWDTATGATIHVLKEYIGINIRIVLFTPCGRTLVTACYEKLIRTWDVATGAEGSITGHETCVEDVVCSPDGRLLGSIGNEGIVRLWNAETGEPSTSLDTVILGAACCIQFSPNSQQFAVGGRDKILRLWDLQTGEPSHSFIGHTHAFFCVTYSPAGDQLASGSSDHTARLWNPTTGESGPVLTGHIGTVSSLSYSPDGAILASCSFDSTVRLWDPTSGRCLGVIRDFFGLIAPVAWKATSEGRFFATGSDDSFVRVWQLIEDGDDDGSEGEIEEGGVGGEGGEGGVEYRVRLHWSSGCDGLAVSDANVQGVVGLSTTNLALLKQRGAIGDPILNN